MTVSAVGSWVKLSGKGLGNIVPQCHSNDFAFIVGGNTYACPSFVAEFLSPRVSKLRQTDSTVRQFHIASVPRSDCFGRLVSLGFGSCVSFDPADHPFIRSVCLELEAKEIWDQLFQVSGRLSAETVVSELEYADWNGSDCEAGIDFAAANFFSLERSSISELSPGMLGRILSHPSLRVETEDDLYQLISSLILKDSSYSILLEYLNYEYLSLSSIGSLVNLISESFEFLTVVMWKRLASRLVPRPVASWNARACKMTFPFRSDSPFDGIIAFLTRVCGGNVSERGIVALTASSHLGMHFRLENVADFDSIEVFVTKNLPNSWVEYDFKDKEVNATHYSLRSRSDKNSDDRDHPMHWAIEGSNDGSAWVELDQRSNCRDLDGTNRSATYPASGTAFFRKIRMRSTGMNVNGRHFLCFGAFELFGVLRRI